MQQLLCITPRVSLSHPCATAKLATGYHLPEVLTWTYAVGCYEVGQG